MGSICLGPRRKAGVIFRQPLSLFALLPAVIGQVVTPTRVGQSYTYSPGQHNQQDLYDVPPSRSQGVGVPFFSHTQSFLRTSSCVGKKKIDQGEVCFGCLEANDDPFTGLVCNTPENRQSCGSPSKVEANGFFYGMNGLFQICFHI